jgi:hypothetical protein
VLRRLTRAHAQVPGGAIAVLRSLGRLPLERRWLLGIGDKQLRKKDLSFVNFSA